jgi:O-antigen ligase
VLAVLALVLAWHSVAWPVALAGVPTILVGLVGHDPFPPGAIALFLAAWTALALLLVAVREEFDLRALLNAPVIATAALAVLMVARLGVSPAHAYGSVKVRLFVAENLVLLVAGIAVARYARHFRILLTWLVVVACATAVVLANGLASGQIQANVGGRFSLDQQASPIGLGRDAANGILVAVFLVLVSRRTSLRLLALGALPVVAVSFIASGSRGPVVGLALGLVVLGVLALRERQARVRIALVALAAVAGALLVAQIVPAADVHRSLSVFNGGTGLSSNGRGQLWHEAWALFRAHPLLGIGVGGFASVDPIDLFPHNLFLELGAEVGILGVLAAAVVVAGAVRALVQAYRVRPSETALVAALLTAAFVNAQVSSDVSGNSGLWLAAGLALGLAQRARAEA